MNYSSTLPLECPYCKTKCQFVEIGNNRTHCKIMRQIHIAYTCTNCEGLIVTNWDVLLMDISLIKYYPVAGDWKPRVELSSIQNQEVREDFEEAINCYNNEFYNASMIMARRAIQQEMDIHKSKGENLYQQIESMEISPNLKGLLQTVKNFGNHGAHPDFSLFDNNGEKIDDKKKLSKLSLEFLDRYFSDKYEIEKLIADAPKRSNSEN